MRTAAKCAYRCAIEIQQAGETVLVSVADLLYVEVYNKESVFHMRRGKTATRLPLETVEARLGGDTEFRYDTARGVFISTVLLTFP